MRLCFLHYYSSSYDSLQLSIQHTYIAYRRYNGYPDYESASLRGPVQGRGKGDCLAQDRAPG